MKIVKIKSRLILLFVLLCISCQKKEKGSILKETKTAYIDYDKDSTFYHIDVLGDEKKENFLVLRYLFVKDSCFGFSNDRNFQHAIQYQSNILKDKEISPYLKYIVKLQNNKSFNKLWEINYPNADNMSYPILRNGSQYKTSEKSPGSYIEEYKFLRIEQISPNDIGFYCLNFKFINKSKWQLISKEKLNLNSENHQQYCIDTISKHLNFFNEEQSNSINFAGAFLYNNKWECN